MISGPEAGSGLPTGDGLDDATWQGLHYLESVAGPGAVADLVEAFARDAGPRVARLKVALAGGDLLQVSKLAHDLKANSATLGAAYLASLALRLEGADPAFLASGALETLTAAEVEVGRVVQAVRGRLRMLEAC